jgi:hypothetical protein
MVQNHWYLLLSSLVWHRFTSSERTDVLYLRLHGGTYVQRSQHAVFRMKCDPSAQEPTIPEYRPWFNWNGTHWFDWTTRHACPLNVAGGKDDQEAVHKPEYDSEKPAGDEGDQQNLSGHPSAPAARAWKIVMWVFFGSVALFCLLYDTHQLMGLQALRHRSAHRLTHWSSAWREAGLPSSTDFRRLSPSSCRLPEVHLPPRRRRTSPLGTPAGGVRGRVTV